MYAYFAKNVLRMSAVRKGGGDAQDPGDVVENERLDQVIALEPRMST